MYIFSTEEALIKDCLRQVSAAQEVFYSRHASKMLAICLRYCRDRMEAEDILHQGFVKAFKHLDTFRGGSLEGWLKRIFVRESINNFHKNKRTPLQYYDQQDHPGMGAISDHDSLSSLSAKEILKLIDTLPEGARVVFNLYAIEGYNHKEIATELGVSESTSKSQYARARQLLRDKLIQAETIDL